MSRCHRGAALVLVLWLIVLLTALVGAFVLNARVEAMQGSIQRGSAEATEVARAGMEYALARLQGSDPRSRWHSDGRSYRWNFNGAAVELKIRDESGKVDLNQADFEMLEKLLRSAGGNPLLARQLAAAIIDWRDADELPQPGGGAENPAYAAAGLGYGPANAPFTTVDELRRVLGMTPELYRKLLPDVTVFGNRVRPDPRYASAKVLALLGLDASQQLARRNLDPAAAAEPVASGRTFGIESRARLGNGREAVLRAVVRASPVTQSGADYTVLSWEQGRGAVVQ